MINLKLIKIIGLFVLFCFTFFFTEKVINVTQEQDEIMIKIKEIAPSKNIPATNAIINEDTIIPGNTGKYIDILESYKSMKKISYYNESLLIYKDVYPEVSIYNNYNLYLTSGNTKEKKVSLIYILNNDKTLDNILNIINKNNTPINFFIDSTFLNNNISIIEKIKNNNIYNYGSNGKYTKDNLIIANNIINNKSNNTSNLCLFLNKNNESLNNCANNKMLSLIPSKNTTYQDIKNNLHNGDLLLITNTQELSSIIDYIQSKGYKIVPLNDIITE